MRTCCLFEWKGAYRWFFVQNNYN